MIRSAPNIARYPAQLFEAGGNVMMIAFAEYRQGQAVSLAHNELSSKRQLEAFNMLANAPGR